MLWAKHDSFFILVILGLCGAKQATSQQTADIEIGLEILQN
jgi:hypothetical protein